jgi:hypothetical protein
MDEVAFSQLSMSDTSRNAEVMKNWQPGIWSHMISLVKIFGLIQDLNHELVNQTHWDEDSIEPRVLSLAAQLANFEYELPSTMVYTLDNLGFHVRRGVGRTFVALHFAITTIAPFYITNTWTSVDQLHPTQECLLNVASIMQQSTVSLSAPPISTAEQKPYIISWDI